MGSHFRRNVVTTSGFFVLRFVVTLIVTMAYIIVAAGIQYAVVGLLGESTFNYIVGGLLSLFLGAIVCDRVGALIFMFVRGWHVAALAYANKIRRAHAPAVKVGIKAFTKNIVGFSAVYAIRKLARGLISDFKDKLWELLADVPLAQNLQQVAENPVVEHLASDVLNYGFDATIFYLVRNPPEDLGDVPSTVLEGLKRYLYCLPSIMLTSVSSYILFRFLPKLLKWLLILWVLFTQGPCAGILITVLMWPIFYILDNAFFNPLTMVMFISCFSKKCDEEVDPDSPAVQLVNTVLEGAGIGTTADDFEDIDDNTEPPAPVEEIADVPPPSPPLAPTDEPSWADTTSVPEGYGLPNEDLPELDGLPLDDAPEEPVTSEPLGFRTSITGADTTPEDRAKSLSALLNRFSNADLNQLAGGDSDSDDDDDGSSPTIDSILSGGEFD